MSKSDDWQTPPELIQVLDNEFRFNLEVCAAADNRALDPKIPYMGLDNGKDALTNDWLNPSMRAIAYCNPPYSQLPDFVFKAEQQSFISHGTGKTIVLLIPAYTDTAIWHDSIEYYADEVRLLRGRLAFLYNGKKQTTARFPSAVVIYRPTRGLGKAVYRLWDWKAALKPA